MEGVTAGNVVGDIPGLIDASRWAATRPAEFAVLVPSKRFVSARTNFDIIPGTA
jgi:hypothetical protein